MSTARPRRLLTSGVVGLGGSLPRLAGAVGAASIAAGLVIKAGTGRLGTPLPPFLVSWHPAADTLAIVSAGVFAIATPLAPRLMFWCRRPFAFAVAVYGLALMLGLALNLAHGGYRGWWSVFAVGPHGSREARFEYLPGLRELRHGIAYYIGHFASLVPSLPLHAAGNPPGPLVALHILGVHTAAALAALCIGAGALTAPLAYDLGRVLGGEQRGRLAGLLTAFAPSMLLFGVASVDYAFATLGLCVACLLTRPARSSQLAGAILAAFVSLFSWLLLAIPAWSVLLAFKRDGRRRGVACAGAAAIGVIAANAALAVAVGYDPIATLRATDAVYRRTTAARPYAYWLFGSPVAWGVMLGLPIAALALRALAAGEPAAVALAIVLTTSSILGFTKGETERIWLPFVPLACVAAAGAPPPKRLASTLGGLTAQALLVELLFNTIW